MTSTAIMQRIENTSDNLRIKFGEEYGNHFHDSFIDIVYNVQKDNSNYLTIIETVDTLIDEDHKSKIIIELKKENKEIKQKITQLEQDNQKLNQDNQELKQDNRNINKKLDVLMRKHYNLVLWQAYKNLEFYIIQKTTGFSDKQMESVNTNLNDFISLPENNKYVKQITDLRNKFNINIYAKSLGKLNRNRINEAHPEPIEMDELNEACDEMKNMYTGIEELYNNYQEIYDYFYQ